MITVAVATRSARKALQSIHRKRQLNQYICSLGGNAVRVTEECRRRPSSMYLLARSDDSESSSLNLQWHTKITSTTTRFYSQDHCIDKRRYAHTNNLFSKNHINSCIQQSAAFSAESSSDQKPIESQNQIQHIRNVAIVAHVDHGKTTIVDELLKCASKLSLIQNENNGDAGNNEDSSIPNNRDSNDDGDGVDGAGNHNNNLVMDCGDLERERGITITSKVTRLNYNDKDGHFKTINVVDTPGHADFAGEVDRILTMIDGVCLIVDAAEGAMAQTKYVLSRALKMKLKPIVVLNKCDKDDAWTRIENGEVEMELLETFDSLGADDEQMEYVTIYSSGKAGWATTCIDTARELARGSRKGSDQDTTMEVLLNSILENIPPPVVYTSDKLSEDHFAMAATTVGYDNFLGRLCTGRIYSGSIQKNDAVVVIPRDYESGNLASSTVTGVFVNRGVNRTELDPPIASVGDIVTISGVPDSMNVGDTLSLKSDPVPEPLETPPLTPPTLSMEIGANSSPFQGREGTIIASGRIRERLISETDNNVTLSVTKSEIDPERSVIHARGELQLGILIEQMRREGYEMTVLPPSIIITTCEESGRRYEPIEEVTIDVDSEYSGSVMNSLTGPRKGLLLHMSDSADGKTRMVFEVPSRGLLGFQSEIATATRGTAVVNHLFLENREYVGHVGGLEKGKLVCNDTGKASLYSLANIAKRGELFVAPGDEVYPGMVIGEYNKSGDLEVNAVKSKEASNVRSVNKDEKLYVPPPKRMTIEELIGYMNDDEVLEVTPKSIRLRKAELDSGARERAARSRKKQMMAAQNKK